jgi:hypothetical protein
MKKSSMDSDKEQWIEGVFSSTQGSARAVPRLGLLEEIEADIYASDHDRVGFLPGFQRKIAVAAAILLVAGNIFAMSSWSRSQSIGQNENSQEELAGQSLISGYNLYN